MKKPDFRPFLLFYSLLTVVVIFAAETGSQWLYWITKPMLMLSLLFFIRKQAGNALSPLITGALVFSLAGDVLLMLDDQYPSLFLPVVLAFLIAHICYTTFFIRDIINSRPWTQHWGQMALATVLVVYAVEFYILNREAFNDLWLPTLIYICVIAIMGISATLRDRSKPSEAYGAIVAGALLFITSDSLLALNKFVYAIDYARALVLGFYALAQLLLVLGLLKIFQFRIAANS